MGGRIRIAAIDGIAVGIDEAQEITSDVTDFAVKWKRDGIAKHAGKNIHLQFELTNASLWTPQRPRSRKHPDAGEDKSAEESA